MKKLQKFSLYFFFRSTHAGILIKTALILPILIILTGVSLDYARLQGAHSTLRSAVDLTTVALAKQPNLEDMTPDEIQQKANEFAAPQMAKNADITNYVIAASLNSAGIVVTGNVEVGTTFLKYRSVNTLNLQQTTSAVLTGANAIEVVMVIDNSGSMGSPSNPSSRISKVISAAKSLSCNLMGEDATCADGNLPNPPDVFSDTVRIGLVPFTGTVNIGKENLTAYPEWFDRFGQSSIHNEDMDLGSAALTTLFDLFTQYADAHRAEYGDAPIVASNDEERAAQIAQEGWRGCVRARNEPYDLDDTPPGINPETLWVPFFAPAEPNENDYRNSYLNIVAPTSLGSRTAWQRDVSKYLTSPPPTVDMDKDTFDNSTGFGPNFNCAQSVVVPLTNSLITIVNAVQSMHVGGNTNIPEGLAWGWRVLSANEPFSQGAPYEDKVTKAIILLTDGSNAVFNSGGQLDENGHNESFYSAHGYSATGLHLGTEGTWQSANSQLNTKLENLCENIKADQDADSIPNDIILYTITFGSVSNNTKNLMENCASGTTRYFDSPNNSQIDQIFLDIANDLQGVRLTQ